MPFLLFILLWALGLMIPGAAFWGQWAATHGVAPITFLLSTIYGVLALAIIPYALRWTFPRIFKS